MTEREDQTFDMQNGQLDGDALDELLRSTREELARLDALMGTSEDEAEQDADETKPQMPVFEP